MYSGRFLLIDQNRMEKIKNVIFIELITIDFCWLLYKMTLKKKTRHGNGTIFNQLHNQIRLLYIFFFHLFQFGHRFFCMLSSLVVQTKSVRTHIKLNELMI